MKTLLIISFCMTFALGAFAQNDDEPIFCTELIRQLPNDETEVIRLTNKSEIRINDLQSGDLYQVAFVREPDSYTMVIKSLKARCFNNKTPVTLYFRNGTKMKLESTNKENCKSLITVNLGQAQKVSVYPNPVHSILRVEHPNVNQQTYEIHNTLGQLVQTGLLDLNATDINITDLKSNIYFLKIDNQTVKLIKQ